MKTDNFASILKSTRISQELTIKEVAQKLSIDPGLLSKIERGNRMATRKQLYRFINFYKLDEKTAIAAWLGDKVIYELRDEPFAKEALRVAEREISYRITTKSGFELSTEIADLITKADELKAQWQSQKPLNKIQLSKLAEYFNVSYTYESNKIEGNTLTLHETQLVVNKGLTIGGKTMEEHLEAINHSEAISFITDLAIAKEPFTEKVLSEIHYLVLKGIDRSNAGKYRSVPVMIAGSSHVPPQPYLVRKKMEDVFDFYHKNHEKIHPVVLAAEMHERIVTVHPFIDGNGRTSRLVMNLILLMHGYTIAILKGDASSRLAYYDALENSRVLKDKTVFHKLIINATIESLDAHIHMS